MGRAEADGLESRHLNKSMALVSNWFPVGTKQDKVIHYCFKCIAYLCAPLPSAIFTNDSHSRSCSYCYSCCLSLLFSYSNEHQWCVTSFVILALWLPVKKTTRRVHFEMLLNGIKLSFDPYFYFHKYFFSSSWISYASKYFVIYLNS